MEQTLEVDQAISHAKGFYKTAHYLMEHCNSETEEKEFAPVAAVNLCLGCEILLKTITYKRSGISPLSGHNLGLVFENHLSIELQNHLAKLFKEINTKNKEQNRLSEAIKIPQAAFQATNGEATKDKTSSPDDNLICFLKYQGLTFLGYRRGMFDWRGHIEHPCGEPFYFNFKAMDAFYQALEKVYNSEKV